MDDASPPYWVLISVIFSSIPLSSTLAMDLYHLAHRLHHSGEAIGEIKSELTQGRVENLKREVAMGHIAGPIFEAELDTERGHASVRFLLTRQGVELGAPSAPSPTTWN